MRKEKIILSIFAAIALICLGIGYAALTDTLTGTASFTGTGVNANGDVNGDGVVDENDNIESEEVFDVDWTSVTPALTDGERAQLKLTETTVIDNDADTLTIAVSNMFLKGDKAVFTCVVTNNSEYDADVTLESSASADHAKVEWSVLINGATAPVVIAAGQTATVVISVELTETLFDATENLDVTYSVKLVATAQAK